VALNTVAIGPLLEAKRRKITSPLVFCTPEGHSLTTNFKRYWQPAVKAAGLTGFRFHDCRHTFASRLVNDGVDRYMVQAAGGWKTASMMQRYAHLEPTTIRAAVERLAHRSSSANGHQNGHQGTARAARGAAGVFVTA
jgi:integrase